MVVTVEDLLGDLTKKLPGEQYYEDEWPDTGGW